MSPVTSFSLLAVAGASLGIGGFAVIVTALLAGRARKLNWVDWSVVLWLVYDAFTHFVLEMSFLYFSLTGTVNGASGVMAEVWKEYAKADARWGESDATIVSLELLTVFFNGPLCIILVHSILYRKSHRHFVQIVLNVCELYGGWMTFCPEWITGSPNLNTSHWLYLWVYLVFFNGLWVVIPIVLLYQSLTHFTATSSHKKD